MPADKLDELRKYAQGLSFEADAIHIASPMGNITLRVVEREAPKCIKFASEGSPVQLYVWIQLLPHGAYESKLRVTVGAEVNFFMKGMVGMLSTVWLILCAMCFGSCMVASGMLRSITHIILKGIKGTASLVCSTVVSGVLLNLIMGDQFLSIIMNVSIYHDEYG